MKKAFKYYFAIWATLLALFNVLAFVSVGWAGQEKYTTSFWIGYVFISLCFLGQLGCAYYAFKDSNLTKVFYGIALYQASYRGLILSFIAGGLCMIISPLPYWIGVIVCAVVSWPGSAALMACPFHEASLQTGVGSELPRHPACRRYSG